jgi:PKHD-type hydroxylase
MKNLFLPEVNLSEVPDFKMPRAAYWSLKNTQTGAYRYILNLFSDSECNEIIKIGKSFYVEESKTFGSKGFNDARKSMNSWLPPCELTVWIFEKIQNAIFEVNKHYEYDLHSIENLQFTEYNENFNGYYDAHVDKFENEMSPNTHRKLSFSVQLTNEKNYEGGNLLIYSDSKMPLEATKQQGSINFFPSFTLHEVTPVTKGTRYSLVSWISGPKFK